MKNIFCSSSYHYCQSFLVKTRKKKDRSKPYPVISVETRNVTGYDVYPTAIKGVVNNDVHAKIQGYITQVLVDEGQYVTAGQPLFRLENQHAKRKCRCS